VVSDGAGFGVASGSDGEGFTAEQLRFSQKDARNLSLLCVGALVVCICMAVFVFTSVPWETRMPYDGKYNRSGSGIPMQIALLPVLVPILGMWRASRRLEKSPRTKAGRIRIYILLAVFVSVCMIAQWTMSEEILVAGGYLPE
jgi:hypothetical protein